VTAWWQQDFYSLDFETTGVNSRADRVVTGTLLHVDPVARTHTAQEWLADPGVEIPEAAAKVHGVTTERARDEGRPAIEVLAEIFEALKEVFASGKALVIYNAPYDLTLFGCEMLRHFEEKAFYVPECVVDPLVIDKRLNKFVRGKGARQLANTCKRYNIVLSEQDAHTSAGDTLAAARLAWTQASSSRLIGQVELDELHRRQRGWFEAQQIEFADYLARKGESEDAERCRIEASTWPMHELRLEEMRPPEPPPMQESGGEVPF
jgi:DNA polymerase-3 subunit epsilon